MEMIYKFILLIFFTSLSLPAHAEEKLLLEMSISHECNHPYMIGISIKNVSSRSIVISKSDLPWSFGSKMIAATASVGPNYSENRLSEGHFLVDYYGKIEIKPGQRISGAKYFKDTHPDFENIVEENPVVIIYMPSQGILSYTDPVTVSGAGISIFFNGKKRIFSKECPIVTSIPTR
jgi:hypothetical protein